MGNKLFTDGVLVITHAHFDHIHCLRDFFNVDTVHNPHELKEFNPSVPLIFNDKDGVWQYEFPAFSVYIDPGGRQVETTQSPISSVKRALLGGHKRRKRPLYWLYLETRARILNTIMTPETDMMMKVLHKRAPPGLLEVEPTRTKQVSYALRGLGIETEAAIRLYQSKHTAGSIFAVIDYPDVRLVPDGDVAFSGMKVAHLLDAAPGDYNDILDSKDSNAQRLRRDVLGSNFVSLDGSHILSTYVKKNREEYRQIVKAFRDGINKATKNPATLVFAYISSLDTIKYLFAVLASFTQDEIANLQVYIAGAPHARKHWREVATAGKLFDEYRDLFEWYPGLKKENIRPLSELKRGAIASIAKASKSALVFTWGPLWKVPDLPNPHIFMCERRMQQEGGGLKPISTEYNVLHHLDHAEIFRFLRVLIYAGANHRNNDNGNKVKTILLAHTDAGALRFKLCGAEGGIGGRAERVEILKELGNLGREAARTGRQILIRSKEELRPVEQVAKELLDSF